MDTTANPLLSPALLPDFPAIQPAHVVPAVEAVLADYRAAIATHQQMVQRHPDHPRVPDALLNIGLAQAEGGDRKSGRATLQGVIDRYPDSTAAQQARDRLPAMR